MTKALARSNSPSGVHFYCSSGGNAGIACATSANSLRQPATIVIPTTANPLIKKILLGLGVNVFVYGRNWAETDKYMREELLAKDPVGIYVPPFDHPEIWEGHSSIVGELRQQLNIPIDGIVCSVGGGGLFNGLVQGVEAYPWGGRKPSVLAVETVGADSLHASVQAGEHVTLPGITSIATSLGAVRVCEQTWKLSHLPNAKSMVVSDADAAISCVKFADDMRIMVEVSCGPTLAAAYKGDLREQFGTGLTDEEWAQKNIVLIVCGGSAVNVDILEEYRVKYGPESYIKI